MDQSVTFREGVYKVIQEKPLISNTLLTENKAAVLFFLTIQY